jgi:hypothetical protein
MIPATRLPARQVPKFLNSQSLNSGLSALGVTDLKRANAFKVLYLGMGAPEISVFKS